ncbi:hypothetical protein BV272_10975, partial [Lactiplantibacillus plantarum]|uniref:hypothetical protein n=1 Tax=Lactiplantibacillus plantarum TaxID=1590 RepID=UPI0010B9BE06
TPLPTKNNLATEHCPPSPSGREVARMANERPPNSVQFVVGYFDTGTLNKALGVLSPLSRA